MDLVLVVRGYHILASQGLSTRCHRVLRPWLARMRFHSVNAITSADYGTCDGTRTWKARGNSGGAHQIDYWYRCVIHETKSITSPRFLIVPSAQDNVSSLFWLVQNGKR